MPEKFEGQESMPTQENSVEKKERELQQKMLGFQFEYAVRLMKREIKLFPKEDGEEEDGEFIDINGFEDVIRNWTRIPNEIRNAYCWRTGKTEKDLQEDAMYKKIFDRIVQEICRQYEENPDLETLSSRSFGIISDIIDTLPQSEEKNKDKEEVGVLGYNIAKSDRDGKDYVDIHFDSLFWQKAQPGKKHLTRENLPEEIKKSCEQLAQVIRKKYPNVAGVACLSWLVGVDWFAEAVGFKEEKSVLANGTGFARGNGFFGQFISKTGELKKKKLQDLINGGKPEYKAKFNFIPREEFLKIHNK